MYMYVFTYCMLEWADLYICCYGTGMYHKCGGFPFIVVFADPESPAANSSSSIHEVLCTSVYTDTANRPPYMAVTSDPLLFDINYLISTITS